MIINKKNNHAVTDVTFGNGFDMMLKIADLISNSLLIINYH